MNYCNYKTIFLNLVFGFIFIAASLCEAGKEPLRMGATVGWVRRYRLKVNTRKLPL
jgi:hypothetical protein